MKKIKVILKKISNIQTIIILTVFYVIVGPFFVLFFLIFRNKNYNGKSWLGWKVKSDMIDDLKKQF